MNERRGPNEGYPQKGEHEMRSDEELKQAYQLFLDDDNIIRLISLDVIWEGER